MIDWISVDDILPESGLVRIKTIENVEHEAFFHVGLVKSHWMIIPCRSAITTDKVTHWSKVDD